MTMPDFIAAEEKRILRLFQPGYFPDLKLCDYGTFYSLKKVAGRRGYLTIDTFQRAIDRGIHLWDRKL